MTGDMAVSKDDRVSALLRGLIVMLDRVSDLMKAAEGYCPDCEYAQCVKKDEGADEPVAFACGLWFRGLSEPEVVGIRPLLSALSDSDAG